MSEFRIIPLQEVRESYPDLADLAEIFNHEIVELDSVWRWKSTKFVAKLLSGIKVHVPPVWVGPDYNKIEYAGLSLNELWVDICHGEIPIEEVVKLHMQMGYSLAGFYGIFDNPAEDMKLENARPVTIEESYNGGHQTIIDWLNEKYKGQILKNL